ncbi:MAG TPA: GAF domain-containing protein, partial [Roseiflexaceae bacterium]
MDTDTSQPAFRRHEIAPLLAAILRVVSSTLDERAIGQTVVDEAVKLLQADRSAIYFLDDRRETLLRFVAVDARDPSTVDTLFYPNSVPVTAQPIFGAALARPEPIAVVDTYDDPRTTRAFFEQFDTRALLLAPLLARAQRLLGFLGFFWVGRPRQLSDDDLALADALGRQAAIAFENARL